MTHPPSPLLHQLHAWFVLVGSAVMAAFLACVFVAAPPGEPRYAYETIDGMRCLVEDASDTVVERPDGLPECVPLPTPRTRIAASH